MYYIYILRSEKVDKFYVGITDNPNQRLLEHNNSERSTFTAKYRPWIMEALFECSEQLGNARRVERYIKKQKSSAFIRKMIENDNLHGILAQLVRVPNSCALGINQRVVPRDPKLRGDSESSRGSEEEA